MATTNNNSQVDNKVNNKPPHVLTNGVKEKKARLSADDWAQGALELMAEQGVAAVAVEPLARRLGVTKGSFYWHYPSRDALLEAALKRWEEDQYVRYSSIGQSDDPHVRLRNLFKFVSGEAKFRHILSALFNAMDHPLVSPVMQRITEGRMEYLTTAYRDAGLSEKEALHRAMLTYAAYVGFLQLSQPIEKMRLKREELDEYVNHMMEVLIP